MKLTSTQQAAVSASGNVVVIAGAGTGKTRTLVERCLECLLRSAAPTDLSEILVVTFTEAAAAEMRQRLRERLQDEIEETNGPEAESGVPFRARASEQLALFETAHIGTLHSFCLELARRHFYLLEVDPQFTVMSEEEARLLANEQLDALFADKYSDKGPDAAAVRELIASHGEGSDQGIRNLVLRLHEYGQTLPDPEGWMDAQLKTFSGPVPAEWQTWRDEALADLKREWLPRLNSLARTNQLAQESVTLLKSHSVEEALPGIIGTREKCPTGKKTAWAEPLKHFYKDAQYLASILPRGNSDPLAEDWSWICQSMRTLLELATEFTDRFSRAKRDLALADFHDLEQFALRLLWENKANAPTKIAEQWRSNFRYVMVDEYQDINAAQDQILRALSRDGSAGNRFLVGDLKQSIYRFRLAAPRIFQTYVRELGGARTLPAEAMAESEMKEPAASRDVSRSGTVIPLNENFRSRERILDFVNSIFELLMVKDAGGLTYDDDARLRFGAPEERKALAGAANDPRVEFHFRKRASKRGENGNDPSTEGETLADLEEAAKEARLVAIRLSELRESGHEIWDEELKAFRAVEWKDMAILLRAPSRKTEFYVREFARLKVPLAVARGGFYESTEISDILSVLTILDNPLQDLPLLAVLRSPIVGLSLEELAQIRLAGNGPLWTALLRWHEGAKQKPSSPQPSPPKEERERRANAALARRGANGASLSSFGGEGQGEEAFSSLAETRNLEALLPKIARFLERFSRWRSLTRQMSLSSCLEEILSETRYSDWLLSQSRGDARLANLQGFVNLTRKFDHFQRQGLLRFLIFIEAQRSAASEPPVPSVIDENAVRLMSIHQSKGLEFPVVVLADCAKPFNLADLKSEIILDDVYGLCPLIKPPDSAKRYPSLSYWLARRRQRKEILGEELRLLYVAITRARDTLILTSSLSESRLNNISTGSIEPVADSIKAARSVADWLLLWFSRHSEERTSPNVQESVGGEIQINGQSLARWAIRDESAIRVGVLSPGGGEGEEPVADNASPSPPREESGGERRPNIPATDQHTVVQSFLTNANQVRALEKKLAWTYAYPFATHQTAKASVSSLRRESVQEDEESAQAFNFQPPAVRISFANAADVGTATHSFLQGVSLDNVGSVAKLHAETERLVKAKFLTPDAAALINFENVARLWQSPLGITIQSHAACVHRELAFTAKLRLAEIGSILGTDVSQQEPDDFVIIQGIADVVLLLPESIQIIDFKTDNVSGKALSARAEQYEPQLKLYALALSRIYKRPVSACWIYFLAAGQAVEVGTSH